MKKRMGFLPLVCLLAVLTLLPLQVYAGWNTTDKGKTYTNASGKQASGWTKINKAIYYFDPKTGLMATGFQKIAVKSRTYRYYFGADGVRRTGIYQDEEGCWYYADPHGRMLFGFIRIKDGKTYYADPKSGVLARNMWVNYDYYFQNDCTMAVNTYVFGKWVGADGRSTSRINVGFVKDGSITYYYGNNNAKVTGWLTTKEGKSYYFTPAMQTGWFDVGSARYYAAADGAVLKNAWHGSRYLKADGTMAVGWTVIGSNTYYFSKTGVKRTGRRTIDGKRYVFSSEGILLKNQWYTVGKDKYYALSDGTKATGLTKIGDYYYYFSEKGALQTQFIKAKDGKWYYANKKKQYLYKSAWFKKNGRRYYALGDCSLAGGLTKIDGKLYYFHDTQHYMIRSTKKTVGSDTYYFQKTGDAAVKKWVQIKKKFYYFGADGKMARNTVVDGYTVSATGERSGSKAGDGWQTVNGKKQYITDGQAATGWQTIGGSRYYFWTDGYMVTGLQSIDGKKYYFYPTGILAAGLKLAIGSKEYTINSEGVVTNEETINVSGSNTGASMAKEGIKYVGNPYVYGGTSLTAGADCSGFVQTLHSMFGIQILRVADDQMHGPNAAYINMGYKAGVQVTANTASMLPGDLVFYGSGDYASHVAMYIGNGKVVHASNSQPYPAGGIKISEWNYQTPLKVMRYWS